MKKPMLLATLCAAALPALAQQALFADAIAPAAGGSTGKAPYLYVGQATTAKAPLALSSQPGKGTPVTTVPAQAPLTVLLATPDKAHYLVKTSLGLTGWIAADAQPAADSRDSEDFSQLKKLSPIPEGLKIEGLPPFALHYNPQRIQPLTPAAQSNEDSYVLLQGQFAANDRNYRLECGPGPSADPYCELLDAADLKQRADGQLAAGRMLGGETFYFPGNGTLYSSTHINRHHQTFSKYRLKDDGQLAEVAQAFYYVGLKSTALAPITLSSQPEGGEPVARIAKGDKLQVLLHDAFRPRKEDDYRDFLLIQASDGSLGWLSVNHLGDEPAPIEDYRFMGD
ncbi:hypothetical protein [Vandammella animalimorsus]|uniref:SH3 domain-containing protein n=1 Tax=Vandammella animalimorsus TaxID=2029117 RepID=A0A2A2AAW7_9BURK|nr:hypothetical protein [Vandammella animalimorsus]PAT35680.1 hypothetical protein CK625_11895 [Vandammella animalimorsus]RMX15234.1 hypothetical protein EBQ34_07630 [Vandammella animalimorsus]